MITSNLSSKISIATLEAEHASAAIDLMTKVFCESDPLIKFLGIRYQDFLPFASDVIHKAIKDGLSKVAVDKQHKVVGCTIVEDIVDIFMPKITHYPKLKPIFSLYQSLSLPFLDDKSFFKGKIIHAWLTFIDRAYRKQGLATQLEMACSATAARKGYDFAYAEFLNEDLAKIVHQFNLSKLCNRIKYGNFAMHNKRKPFEGLEGAAAAFIVAIRPGVNLNSLTHCYTEEEYYKP
jgi:hypothetical protein